jgi:hypothetical protein
VLDEIVVVAQIVENVPIDTGDRLIDRAFHSGPVKAGLRRASTVAVERIEACYEVCDGAAVVTVVHELDAPLPAS